MATIANTEMAAAWDGPEGDHWTVHADRYALASRRHWERFLDAVPIEREDSVLDIGCGTGRSTRDVGRIATAGSALGVDLSARMLEHARETARAEKLTNVRFEQADAQVHLFAADAFDIAISSFGAMFFSDPTAAFSNVGRALRPEGGVAMLAWRELARNEWLTAVRDALAVGRTLPEPPPHAPGPFGLANDDHVRGLLGAAGFENVRFEEIDEPVEFGTDADDAFSFLATLGMTRGLTEGLDDDDRSRAMDALHRTVAEHDTGEGVLFGSSAWLITARVTGRMG